MGSTFVKVNLCWGQPVGVNLGGINLDGVNLGRVNLVCENFGGDNLAVPG